MWGPDDPLPVCQQGRRHVPESVQATRDTRYTIEVWVDPGVQVDVVGTDDRTHAFAFRDDMVRFAKLRGHRRPVGVIYDNDRDGAIVDGDCDV